MNDLSYYKLTNGRPKSYLRHHPDSELGHRDRRSSSLDNVRTKSIL
jgi:hypothetical protein